MALLAFGVRKHTIVCADNAMLDLRDVRHKTEKGDPWTQVSVCGWYGGHCGSSDAHVMGAAVRNAARRALWLLPHRITWPEPKHATRRSAYG
jgi:hypothetical protein